MRDGGAHSKPRRNHALLRHGGCNTLFRALFICCETLTFLFQYVTVQTQSTDLAGARQAPGSPTKVSLRAPRSWPLSWDALEKGNGTRRLLSASGWLRPAAMFQCPNLYQLSSAPRGITISYRSFFSPPCFSFFLFFLVHGEDAVQNDPEYWGLWSLVMPVFSG